MVLMPLAARCVPAVCVLLTIAAAPPNSSDARTCRHILSNNPTYGDEYPNQMQDCSSLTDQEIIAISKFWTGGHDGQPVYIDPGFLSDRALRKAVLKGIPLKRDSFDNGNTSPGKTAKVAGLCTYYNSVFYWKLPKHGIYVLYERVHYKDSAQQDEAEGWLHVVYTAKHWQVSDLPSSDVATPIQAAICKTLIWKPVGGRTLHLYVVEPNKIAPYIHAGYVDIKSSKNEPDDQGTKLAELDVGFGGMFQIGHSMRLVKVTTVTKTELADEAEMISTNLLVSRQSGHWKAYYFGAPGEGE